MRIWDHGEKLPLDAVDLDFALASCHRTSSHMIGIEFRSIIISWILQILNIPVNIVYDLYIPVRNTHLFLN